MTYRFLAWATALLALSGYASAQPSPTSVPSDATCYGFVDDAYAERLQAELDTVREAGGFPGVVMAVVDGCGSGWTGSSGASDLESLLPLDPQGVFRIGSITKPYVAVVIMQLVDEGTFSLDSSVAAYVTIEGLDERVTLRQLLNHTSGIFDYVEDMELMMQIMADPARVWAPSELASAGLAAERYFEPGEGWMYSNTDYIILGMVAETVTGSALGELIRERVTAPLNLENTVLDGSQPDGDQLTPGYSMGPDGTLADATHMLHPSAPWAAGAIISTADEVAQFARALFGGELLPEQTLEQMMTPVLNDDLGGGYGLGIGMSDVEGFGRIWGHYGGIPGYASILRHSVERNTTVVLLFNTDAIDPGQVQEPLFSVGFGPDYPSE